MMTLTRWLGMAAVAATLSVGTATLTAQDRPGRGNFDPAQFRDRMMERYKDQLEVKDDTEWKAIEPLVSKVMDARMQAFSGMGRGMFGRGGRGQGQDGNNNNNNGDRGGRRGGFFGGEPSPEAEALQKAIDGKASNSELKAALAKYNESRKARQAELEKAQAELRKVLTVRQEAIASMSGLL